MHAKLKGILSTPIQATICNDQTKRHCLTKLHVQPVKDPPFTLASPVQWRSNYQIQSMSISWQALCHSTWLSLEKSKRFWSFSYHFELDCLFDLGSNEKALSDQIIRPTGERSPFHSSPSPVQWRSNYQIQSMSISLQALCHSTWLSLEKVQ